MWPPSPICLAPGHTQSRAAPVASVITWIPGALIGPVTPFRARASLLPSGDSAMLPSCAAFGFSGRGNAVNRAVSRAERVAGLMTSRKNVATVAQLYQRLEARWS